MYVEMIIKKVRTEKNMSLAKLAERTGLSSSHINDVEKGIKEPGITVLIRLAKGLGVSVTDLYKVHW